MNSHSDTPMLSPRDLARVLLDAGRSGSETIARMKWWRWRDNPMLGNSSRAWHVLERVVDSLIQELSDNDLDALHTHIEAERTRRFVQARRPPSGCGFCGPDDPPCDHDLP